MSVSATCFAGRTEPMEERPNGLWRPLRRKELGSEYLFEPGGKMLPLPVRSENNARRGMAEREGGIQVGRTATWNLKPRWPNGTAFSGSERGANAPCSLSAATPG